MFSALIRANALPIIPRKKCPDPDVKALDSTGSINGHIRGHDDTGAQFISGSTAV